MTLIWTTQISERKWRRVRRELEDNGLDLPFSSGVAHNKKSGYRLLNNYSRDTGKLEIKIVYGGDGDEPFNVLPVILLLNRLFDSSGTISR